MKCSPVLKYLCVSVCVFSQVVFGQFVPNDPYFDPGTSAGTQPGYYGQWHLVNQMPITEANAGLDVNILGAWQRGLTGAGVTISIIDNGTDSLHPDLSPGFQNNFSWDYSLSPTDNWASDNRGSPVFLRDNHGTSVAGVAAARGGNGIGVTGAAPLANNAAQRLLTGEVYYGGISATQAQIYAIGFQGQTDANGNPDPTIPFTGSSAPVRVMNHSYGPQRGLVPDPDSDQLLTALRNSADLGVLHVYAAGNQRGEYSTADTNKIRTNTSPHVLVVAALGSDGKFSDYSSYGASVVVTAPSASLNLFEISTTDRRGLEGYNNIGDVPDPPPDEHYFTPVDSGDLSDYTSTFGGTSSSAPLVAGIMALGVEANANMNVRMARHLLARTSVKVDAGDPDWLTNAAGYQFNKNYGFGLIDADAFTRQAELVTSLSAPSIVESDRVQVGDSFSPTTLSLSQEITMSLQDPLPIEYVRVHLSLSGFQDNGDAYDAGIGAMVGDISGILISPSNTSYELFSNDRFLIDADLKQNREPWPTISWNFTSYAYFGEDVNGTWELQLFNGSTNMDSLNFGTWDVFQMEFGLGSIAIIPEPTVMAFLIVALAGMVLLRRRSARRDDFDGIAPSDSARLPTSTLEGCSSRETLRQVHYSAS